MQRLKAIGTLVRWPNLIFIALTQVLSSFFLVKPILEDSRFDLFQHAYLVLCTVFIAAAGYMINDYFDWQIDTVNKPERVVVGKLIQRRTIILGHLGLNLFALILAYLSLSDSTSKWVLLWPFGSAVLLWFYSTKFKRQFLIGNVVVALMTALTVALPALFSAVLFSTFDSPELRKLYTYIGFAFLITLIREIVKDIEDIKGDATQACQTVPLVWGINRARYLVDGLWIVCLFALAVRGYLANAEQVGIQIITLILILPIPYLIWKMHKAKTGAEFNRLSTYVKVYTLMGILSILV